MVLSHGRLSNRSVAPFSRRNCDWNSSVRETETILSTRHWLVLQSEPLYQYLLPTSDSVGKKGLKLSKRSKSSVLKCHPIHNNMNVAMMHCQEQVADVPFLRPLNVGHFLVAKQARIIWRTKIIMEGVGCF